jgi:hypothetical protein
MSFLTSIDVKANIERELTLRALAAVNLDTFASYIKDDFIPNWFTHKLHNIIQKFVDDSIAGKSPRLILTTPPRHGKTQAVTRALAAFIAAYMPKSQSIFVTHTDKLAGDNGADARAIIESPEYARVFNGVQLDPEHRSREDMRFKNGSKVKFTSIGSALPGYGGEVIVVDDYFRNNEEADSQLIRDRVFDWLRGTLFNRVHPGGGIIITATRWHVDDPIGRLMSSADTPWTLLEFPAIAKVDEPDRLRGECLHPRWSLEQLNILRRESGERVFASLYQCSPYLESGNFFNKEHLKYYAQLPKNLSFVIGADYATSDSTSADHTALIPAGLDQDSNLYIAPDYVYSRLEPRRAVVSTVKLAKRYKTQVLCHEKGVIANVLKPIFNDVYKAENYYLVTERYVRKSGKALYALAIKARMEAGKILFPLDKKEEVERLLLSFDPKSDGEDDFVDALASVCVAIDRAAVPIPLPELPTPDIPQSPALRASDDAKRTLEERDRMRNNPPDSAYGW